LWTWKGTIELSGSYNEAFNDAGMVEKYLTTIKEMVFDGLDIDLSE
jgi:chitinase